MRPLDRDIIKGNILDDIDDHRKRLDILERLVGGGKYSSYGGEGLVGEGPGIDIVVNTVGLGGDAILVYRSDGMPVAEYLATYPGLVQALALSKSGESVEWPNLLIPLTGNIDVPAGVTLRGRNRERSILSASLDDVATLITVGDGAVIENFSLAYTCAYDDAANAYGIALANGIIRNATLLIESTTESDTYACRFWAITNAPGLESEPIRGAIENVDIKLTGTKTTTDFYAKGIYIVCGAMENNYFSIHNVHAYISSITTDGMGYSYASGLEVYSSSNTGKVVLSDIYCEVSANDGGGASGFGADAYAILVSNTVPTDANDLIGRASATSKYGTAVGLEWYTDAEYGALMSSHGIASVAGSEYTANGIMAKGRIHGCIGEATATGGTPLAYGLSIDSGGVTATHCVFSGDTYDVETNSENFYSYANQYDTIDGVATILNGDLYPMPVTIALDDLTDVSASAPNDGDALVWDSGTSAWIAQAPTGGALALDDLTDVSASAPTDDQVLTWDSGTSAWIATTPAAASIDGTYLHEHIYQEDLSSLCDGSKLIFYTANAYETETTMVWLNGVLQRPVTFYAEDTTSYDTITFTTAPQVGDELIIAYVTEMT